MPFDLPPETPWYVALIVFALYGVWKLIEPYVRARVLNAAKQSSAETAARIERIEIEQRRQIAQIESEKALLQHLGNLVNKVNDLADAFIASSKGGAEERAAWLAVIERMNDGLEALVQRVDALPERIVERLTEEKE